MDRNQPPTMAQPNHFTQSQVLASLGHTTIHSFMKSQKLNFTNASHYSQAQTMLDQQRSRLQKSWESSRSHKAAGAKQLATVTGIGMEEIAKAENVNKGKATVGETELKELGVMMGATSLQPVKLEKETNWEARKEEKKERIKATRRVVQKKINESLKEVEG